MMRPNEPPKIIRGELFRCPPNNNGWMAHSGIDVPMCVQASAACAKCKVRWSRSQRQSMRYTVLVHQWQCAHVRAACAFRCLLYYSTVPAFARAPSSSSCTFVLSLRTVKQPTIKILVFRLVVCGAKVNFLGCRCTTHLQSPQKKDTRASQTGQQNIQYTAIRFHLFVSSEGQAWYRLSTKHIKQIMTVVGQ